MSKTSDARKSGAYAEALKEGFGDGEDDAELDPLVNALSVWHDGMLAAFGDFSATDKPPVGSVVSKLYEEPMGLDDEQKAHADLYKRHVEKKEARARLDRILAEMELLKERKKTAAALFVEASEQLDEAVDRLERGVIEVRAEADAYYDRALDMAVEVRRDTGAVSAIRPLTGAERQMRLALVEEPRAEVIDLDTAAGVVGFCEAFIEILKSGEFTPKNKVFFIGKMETCAAIARAGSMPEGDDMAKLREIAALVEKTGSTQTKLAEAGVKVTVGKGDADKIDLDTPEGVVVFVATLLEMVKAKEIAVSSIAATVLRLTGIGEVVSAGEMPDKKDAVWLAKMADVIEGDDDTIHITGATVDGIPASVEGDGENVVVDPPSVESADFVAAKIDHLILYLEGAEIPDTHEAFMIADEHSEPCQVLDWLQRLRNQASTGILPETDEAETVAAMCKACGLGEGAPAA